MSGASRGGRLDMVFDMGGGLRLTGPLSRTLSPLIRPQRFAAVARPELGVKRQCMNCGAKFYDLDRDPATCPKCGTIYQVATSRVAPPVASRAADDDEEEDEKSGPEIVSLDEAESNEDDADISVDDEEG